MRLNTLLTVMIAAAISLSTALADNVNWTGSVNSTWDTTTANWTGDDTVFANGDNVTFGNTGSGTIAIATGTLSPNDMTFNHSSGTYQFNTGGGNLTATGNLALTGGGIVQFGGMTNTPANYYELVQWTGSTTISGGSRLNLTRGGNGTGAFQYIGGNASTVTIDNGTLALGADNSATRNLNNAFSIGSGGATIINQAGGNPSIYNFSGNFTGSSSLTLRNTGSTAFFGRSALSFNGTNSGFTGAVSIIGNAPNPGDVGPGFASFTTAAGLFNNASSVTVTEGGMARFSFAVTDSNLSNFSVTKRGGIAVDGASGSLSAVTTPMTYVAEGGYLVLDNRDAINNDRIGDSTALALNSNRFNLVGRNAGSSTINEDAGAITYAGGSRIILTRTNTTSNFVNLSIDSLNRTGTGTMVIETVGTGSALNSTANITITGTAPTVTNGMITPTIIDGTGHHFLTHSSGALNTAAASYTTTAGGGSYAPVSTEIANINVAAGEGNATLSSTGTVHALRVSNANTSGLRGLDLSSNTLTVGSGGVILNRVGSQGAVISNGTLAFGSNEALIYAGGAGAGTISAIISGSGGLTKFGSQTLVINNGSNSFTGGVNINEGNLQVGGNVNALNSQNVNISQFGALTVAVSGLNVGGISGNGRVLLADNTARAVNIGPASGTHTFEGLIQNGFTNALSVNKTSSGTQVFGVNSVGTYTGATRVEAGTLLINGNFASANGSVTVLTGATLGGNGVIGGATTVQSGGTLAPGNSPGLLTFNSSLTLSTGSNTAMEIGAITTRGGTYDAVNVGGALTYGGTLTLSFGSTYGAGTYSWNLFDFGSQSSDFNNVLLTGAYTGSLLNSGGIWSLTAGTEAWTFTQSNGVLALTTTIPEPATGALVAGSLTALVIFRRRRQG